MKRFLSVFFVLVVLFGFSVTCFASDVYIPKTVELEYNPDTYTYSVPDGVDVYVGDTISFNHVLCNVVSKTGLDPSEVYSVIPQNIGVSIDGQYVATFWYLNDVPFSDEKFDATGCFRRFTLEKPGKVTFKVEYWQIIYYQPDFEGPGSYSLEPYPVIAEFELKDPALAPAEVRYRGIWQSLMAMVSGLVKTIVDNPLILVFVILSLVGLGVGIFKRLKK